jgi:hypothetical protein
MVQKYFKEIYFHLKENKDLVSQWRLPCWFGEKDLILSLLVDYDSICEYTEFHDIGKPFCLEIDFYGKQHFPDHANVSEYVYRRHFNQEETVVSRLIKMDMDIHTKDLDIEKFCNRKEAITLLLVGLCELHSNCEMFGGIESVSFKIKWKKLQSRGNKIIKKMKGSL